jgi:hypothetical protein
MRFWTTKSAKNREKREFLPVLIITFNLETGVARLLAAGYGGNVERLVRPFGCLKTRKVWEVRGGGKKLVHHKGHKEHEENLEGVLIERGVITGYEATDKEFRSAGYSLRADNGFLERIDRISLIRPG